jgi:septum formation protein
MPLPLVLASSSPYRRQLLSRLGIPFFAVSPDIDERPLVGENPEALALRLAQQKAEALAAAYPRHWIIGSDQVAVLAGKPLGKPGNLAQATAQLRASSGTRVDFITALCLLNSASGEKLSDQDCTSVYFRELQDDEIARYLAAEQPFDCAGSFKAEGLGITLFDKITSDDPAALIGLPLIKLAGMLRAMGANLP